MVKKLLRCALLTLLSMTIQRTTYWGVEAQQGSNPELELPLLANTTQTFRYNYCDLSDQVLVARTLSLDRALEGVEVRVALMEGEFVNWKIEYQEPNNPASGEIRRTLDPNFPGLVPRLLDEICARAGCTWRSSFASLSYDDLPEDKSFLDLLLWTTEMYDINADWWMRSKDRLKAGATFTEPWYDATVIMIAPNQNADEKDKFDPWGWLDPFDRSVWIMVIATLFGSAVIHWLLHVVLNPNADPEVWTDPMEVTWRLATAFAGQFEFDPPTGPARLFTFSIAFWALLMTSAYTANLASFLVIRNTPDIRIDSLAQAVQMNKILCVWRSSATDVIFTNAFPDYAVSGRLKRLPQRKVYEGLQTGECEIAITEVSTWDVFQNDKTVNEDCSLGWIGRPYKTIPASFGVKGDAGTYCTSLLRDVFNLYLHDMEGDQTIENFWNEHIKQTATVSCNIGDSSAISSEDGRRLVASHKKTLDSLSGNEYGRTLRVVARLPGGGAEDPDTTRLTLTNMGGVFMLHGILSVASLLLALISYWLRAQKSSKSLVQDNISPPQALKSDTPINYGKIKAPSITSHEIYMGDEGSTHSLYYFDAECRPMGTTTEASNIVPSHNDNSPDALRNEMNLRLQTIDAKLTALIKNAYIKA